MAYKTRNGNQRNTWWDRFEHSVKGTIFTFLSIFSFNCTAAVTFFDNNIEPADISLRYPLSLAITSNAKLHLSLSGTATLLSVIAANDIGVSAIREAFRYAPGLLVTRADTGNYAIVLIREKVDVFPVNPI